MKINFRFTTLINRKIKSDMMLQLQDIKKLRKKFNLTQGELAKKANVSQSLIAKIESKRIDPAYTRAKQILDTLELLDQKNEIKIKDFMSKKIIYVSSNDKIKDIIKKMKNFNISQIPVIENNLPVGLVTESSILERITSSQDPASLTVKDIMNEPPPSISIKTSQRIAVSLLKHFPMLLVTKKGRISGIITKSDLLEII